MSQNYHPNDAFTAMAQIQSLFEELESPWSEKNYSLYSTHQLYI